MTVFKSQADLITTSIGTFTPEEFAQLPPEIQAETELPVMPKPAPPKPVPPKPPPEPEPEPAPPGQLEPGSHWYELGFRTKDEVAKRGDAHYGIHAGSDVPDNSIVITLVSGKQVRLVGEEIKRRGMGAVEEGLYTIPATGHDGKTVYLTPEQIEAISETTAEKRFGAQIEAGLIDKEAIYVSEDIYIPGAAVDKMADDSPDLHRILTEKGYEAYETEVVRINEEYAQYRNDIVKMEPYKDKKTGEYNVANAINAGVPQAVLTRLFGAETYSGSLKDAHYIKATPTEKFNILVASGRIPAGSKFDSIDKDGNIVYYSPDGITIPSIASADFKALESEFLKASRLDQNITFDIVLGRSRPSLTIRDPRLGQGVRELNLYDTASPSEQKAILSFYVKKYKQELSGASQTEIEAAFKESFKATERQNLVARNVLDIKQTEIVWGYEALTDTEKTAVLSYFSALEPMKVLGITIPRGAVPSAERLLQVGKMIAGVIPVVGTAVFWNEPAIQVGSVTIPKNAERAASILLDALIVTAWLKPGLIIRSIAGAGKAKELQMAGQTFRQGLRTSVSTLRRVDKSLVAPFKKMATAQRAYGANLANIRELERILSRTAGEVVPSIRENLAAARRLTNGLEVRLRQSAKQFAEAQQRAARAAYDDIPLARTSFVSDIVKDTERTVAMAFRDVKGVQAAESQLAQLLVKLSKSKLAAAKAARLTDALASARAPATRAARLAMVNAMEQQAKILKAAQSRVGQLSMELAEVQSKLLLAKSGKARALSETLRDIKAKLERLQNELLKVKHERRIKPEKEVDYEGIIWNLNKQIKESSAEGGRVRQQLAVAIDTMEAEWYQPLTKGRGRTLTPTVPTVTAIPGASVGTSSRVGQTLATGVRGITMAVANRAIPEAAERLAEVPERKVYPVRTPSPVTKPVPEPVIKPVPEPVTKPVPEPVPKPVPEPVPKPVPEPVPKPVPEPVPKPVPKPVLKPVPKPPPKPVPKPVPKLVPKPVPKLVPDKVGVEIKTKRVIPKAPVPLLVPSSAQVKANRKTIKKAGGAIAWRQGKVGGKDRWDTVINPYRDDSHYLMVLGDPPDGATIVTRGKGSARATAQVLFGKGPKSKVLIDSGFQDITIMPTGEKRIDLHFKPDPEGLTKGDITIGERREPISERRPRLSSGRFRITPRRPRIS